MTRRSRALGLLLAASAARGADLRVGVSTPAYHSWVAAVTEGTPVEVVPLLPAGADLHGYQPRPGDVALLGGLDLLVRNDLGHDAWVDRLLGLQEGDPPVVVDLHRGVPLLPQAAGPAHSHGDGEAHVHPPGPNPHTFLSLSTAAQQVHALARALAAAAPAHAARFHRNARAYARELRKLLAETRVPLLPGAPHVVATVHDGYAYLLQELGVRVAFVVQPRHGIDPSARELAEVADALRARGIRVLFTERDFPRSYAELLAREAGVHVAALGHVSGGDFSRDRFLAEMRASCAAIVDALGPGRPGAP